jgi:lysyl-tRNA synthetase class 2
MTHLYLLLLRNKLSFFLSMYSQSSEQLRTVIQQRSQLYDSVRNYFRSEGFLEVETPLLVAKPGTEPYLEVFETIGVDNYGTCSRLFLPTSPELSMKKLLGWGSGSVFQICKSFRNGEPVSQRHHPEFTILEWYRTPGDYTDIMRDCEQLLHAIVDNFSRMGWSTTSYDLAQPWERLSILEAFERYSHMRAEDVFDEEKLPQLAQERGCRVENLNWEDAFHWFLLNDTEPHLGLTSPTILYDYPIQLAALSLPKASDNRLAERFEFYWHGVELGNAFSELTDEVEQRRRMVADLAKRAELGKVPYQLDEEFLQALKTMPRTGGIAVGLDRVLMQLIGAESLQEILPFHNSIK